MPLVSDQCLCLRRLEYSETSQILALFGRREGIVRLIAKGAHRRTKAGASKFDGGVDLLDRGQAVFSLTPQRDLSTLTEWHLEEGHLELRKNLRALLLGQYAAELVNLLIEEHDPHPDLFDRLDQTLRELATPRMEEAFLAFELELLREAGYLPELGECVGCGTAGGALADRAGVYFSPGRGGILCRNCEGGFPDRQGVDPRLIRLAMNIARLPRVGGATQRLPRLTRQQTDPLNRLLAEHVQHTTSRRLRLADYVVPTRMPALQR